MKKLFFLVSVIFISMFYLYNKSHIKAAPIADFAYNQTWNAGKASLDFTGDRIFFVKSDMLPAKQATIQEPGCWDRFSSFIHSAWQKVSENPKTSIFLTLASIGTTIAILNYFGVESAQAIVTKIFGGVAGATASVMATGGGVVVDAAAKATTKALEENPELVSNIASQVGRVMGHAQAAQQTAMFSAIRYYPTLAFTNVLLPVLSFATPFLLERYKIKVDPTKVPPKNQ
jgi:hypothetical protein